MLRSWRHVISAAALTLPDDVVEPTWRPCMSALVEFLYYTLQQLFRQFRSYLLGFGSEHFCDEPLNHAVGFDETVIAGQHSEVVERNTAALTRYLPNGQ